MQSIRSYRAAYKYMIQLDHAQSTMHLVILFLLFIATMAPEAQLSTCLDSLPCDKKPAADTAVCEDCNIQNVRWYNTKFSEGTCLICFQEKYCKVYIAIGLLYVKM